MVKIISLKISSVETMIPYGIRTFLVITFLSAKTLSEITLSSHLNINTPLFLEDEEDEVHVYRNYNRKTWCEASEDVHYPKSIEEVQNLVQYAIKNNLNVKALGTRHSATDVLCTDGVPIDMHGINRMTWNSDDETVTTGAGTFLINLAEFLDSNGRALIAMPTFGGITVGGAIALGVHGSSLTNPSTISDLVISMRVLDGLGNIQLINKPQDLRAFRVNLGLLGILVEVTLATVKQFKIQVIHYEASDEILLNGVAMSIARQSDFFSIWWLPNDKSVVVGDGQFVEVSVPGNAFSNFIPDIPRWQTVLFRTTIEVLQELRLSPGLEFFEDYNQHALYQYVFGKPPIYTENGQTLTNPAVGLSHRLFSNRCSTNKSSPSVCVWSNGKLSIYDELISFAMDVDQLPNLVKEVEEVLRLVPANFPLISIFLRFGRASDAFMAIQNGRETVHVEISLPSRVDQYNSPKMGLAASQAIVQAWVNKLEARAHWAKNGYYYLNKDILERSYPDRPLFIDAMKKYDPNGVFLNDFGRRLLGESNKQTVDPQVTHCALQDYCLCQKNSDCATFQTCSSIRGYPVCKDRVTLPWSFNVVPLITNLRLSFLPKSDQ